MPVGILEKVKVPATPSVALVVLNVKPAPLKVTMALSMPVAPDITLPLIELVMPAELTLVTVQEPVLAVASAGPQAMPILYIQVEAGVELASVAFK